MVDEKDTERKKLLLAKIAQFRLFDDDFMSKVFEDDIEATEFLLKIILQRDDLEVTESKGQVSIKNLLGRSVPLDIKARDKTGKIYNIEVRRTDEGADEKRARYYNSSLDANTLLPHKNFKDLPETYVIFITEHDVLKCGLPLYHINRTIKENGMTFGDESNIIYVNGEYRGENEIGKLMHDFSCNNPDEMQLGLLAEKTRYFKKDEKGLKRMCKIMEDFAAEERNEEREEMAISLLEDETLSISKIAEVSKLSENKIKELAEKVKVTVQSKQIA
ncbi:MAG: PD-(D/E)XK nuclease family transposase [Treponema sp.]|nr:PD-(D/E)XK nuclease family transposase [Treponema sp.]